MGLVKPPDGKLYILPMRKDERFYSYREHYKPPKMSECNLPNKVNRWYLSVWHEEKKELQSLMCGEQLYNALLELQKIFKQHYPHRQSILVMTAEGNLELRPRPL